MDSACPWLAQWILTIFRRDGSKLEVRFRSDSQCCPRDLVQSITSEFYRGSSKSEVVFGDADVVNRANKITEARRVSISVGPVDFRHFLIWRTQTGSSFRSTFSASDWLFLIV